MGEALTARRVVLHIAVATVAAIVTLVVTPLVGSTQVDLSKAIAGVSPDNEVLFVLRLPRVLLAMITGGCLSLAGAMFQALLRDALATPYTLGVSSGASLGAVVALVIGWRDAGSLPAVWVAALGGAGIVLMLVMRIASGGGRVSSFTLLLAGVTINSICLALILFLHNLAGFLQSFAISRWLMGGIDSVEYRSLAWLCVLVVPACWAILARAREWNVLAVGEEWAAARGLAVTRLLRTGYVAGSVLTGAVTALTGPIGFVGLIVPHALRLRLGPDHRVLLPCSFLWGAAFLAICDTVARVVLAPTEVPVGVITALLGGPFFIWLLRSRRGSLWL